MPGRKSNLSTVTNGEDTPGAENPASAAPPARSSTAKESMSVEDLSLPRTMIQRLAKGVLPANTSIQKDALLALSKSATVFVNFIANSRCQECKRERAAGGKKTIQPADVLAALKEQEFEGMVEKLEAELKRFNAVQCDKRNSYRRRVKEEKAAASVANGDITMEGDTLVSEAVDESVANGRSSARNGEEPPSKRVRRAAGEGAEDDDEDAEDNEGDEDEEDGDEEMEDGDEREGEGEEADEDGDLDRVGVDGG
ncbi:hypothetical protein H2203_003093 [Taxawa tesnikishii (nom. ined.)]|nr:hypothetical protein H2203_003093 [Dothideales sp. JES 119]